MGQIEKPPYRVPTMAEIAAMPPNGLTVASFFAGAGGSSTGYRMAGFKVLYANEFVPIAQESYKANAAPYTVVDGRDVKKVTAADVLKACGLKAGELDVLDGSPPCQAFSTAGRREKGWGTERHYEHGDSQKNEELFTEFIRLRNGIKPRVFVAENVSGLVKGTAKGFFLEILAELKKGYDVVCPLLDAQWLGVPQARQRIVFIGVRNDLGLTPPVPAPLPYRYSVRDALPWISRVVHDTRGSFQSGGTITDRPSVTIMSSAYDAHHFQVHEEDHALKVEVVGNKNAPHSRKGERRSVDEPVRTLTARRSNVELQRTVEPETDISSQAIGREYDKLNPGQQSDKYFSLVRADANEPCPTITAAGGQNSGIACVVHPTEKRKFSILEVKRLCSFPDDAILKGTYGQQWERLGNSVPPLMMKAVAEAVRDKVLLPWRDQCEKRRTNGSGKRSTKKGRMNAGPGRLRRSETAKTGIDTDTSGMESASSPRTSSRSKKNSGVPSSQQ